MNILGTFASYKELTTSVCCWPTRNYELANLLATTLQIKVGSSRSSESSFHTVARCRKAEDVEFLVGKPCEALLTLPSSRTVCRNDGFIIGTQEGQSNWREASSYPKHDSRGARIVVFCCGAGAVAKMYNLHCYRQACLLLLVAILVQLFGVLGLGSVRR